MKRLIMLLIACVCATLLMAQQSASTSSDGLEKAKKDLDKQILDFSTKIDNVVKDYKLQDVDDIRILPYRTNYKKSDEGIEMIRHTFIRHDRTNEIIGMRTKSLKVFSGGKFESRIWERNYDASHEEEVIVTDPSPTSEGTDDITFSYKQNGKVIFENRKLGDVRNVDAFPVANQIRRDFYVKHLSFFYYTVLTIAETYQKNSKDTDTFLRNFMEKSTEF